MIFSWLLPEAGAWIDYGDAATPVQPAYGKPFLDLALKLEFKEIELPLDSELPFRFYLQNRTGRQTLVLPEMNSEGRDYALHLVFATESGETFFSENLLTDDHPLSAGTIPTEQENLIAERPVHTLRLARVTRFLAGRPELPPAERMLPMSDFIPRLYTVRAILTSGTANTRPDFVIGSENLVLLLRPISGERMTTEEREARLNTYLKRLRTDAYGGQAVSTQLAALGDIAVTPLIETADAKGDGKVRESRIWAIVTLCNMNSERAENYILARLKDPVDLGDLNFLAWHSQGLQSEKVDAMVLQLLTAVAANEPMPWEKTFPDIPAGVMDGFAEFALKNFTRRGLNLPSEVVVNSLKNRSQKTAAFAIGAWVPDSNEEAVKVLMPVFTRREIVPNLKAAALARLASVLPAELTAVDNGPDVAARWFKTGEFLTSRGMLDKDHYTAFLTAAVLSAPPPAVQTAVIHAWQKSSEAFPVRQADIVLPENWIQTWQYVLETAEIEKDEAVRFLCRQMMTKEEPGDMLKLALLKTLRKYIGNTFPYSPEEQTDLTETWATCGQWLVEHGYFGAQ